ncbi:MAG TPA: CDP-alcohol phosphatidyltransferase family protein [Gemmatimonadaceae bacterium]|jgi:phosphatidylglycerophosphate synthase|nr:CDP-alcohol phosphatidyltransferase family protein [Gemmatimonadaceae bacterium]
MAARAGLRALPNILSSSRVLLAAGFAASGNVDARLGLVGLAAATDVLDGWIARRAKWTTRWGALIDPFADRVFALVAISTFLFTGALSTAGYFVMISRDIMTAVGFLVARMIPWLQKVPFRARASGKVVTILQLITLVALLRFPSWTTGCLWAVGAASAFSIVDYTFALWRARTA